jgi:hypothetical protein
VAPEAAAAEGTLVVGAIGLADPRRENKAMPDKEAEGGNRKPDAPQGRLFKGADGHYYLDVTPPGAMPVEPIRCFIREDGVLIPGHRITGWVAPLAR